MLFNNFVRFNSQHLLAMNVFSINFDPIMRRIPISAIVNHVRGYSWARLMNILGRSMFQVHDEAF